MIAKGNLHNNGGKLAAYLVTGEGAERAELVELRGFASDDIRTAFLDVEIQAYGTRCTKPFFHAYTRLAPGEELTREQWLQVADREEKRLGFKDQPRAIAFHHLADGSTHMHVAWSRIDAVQMRAIDPGLFKNHLKEISRALEIQLGLQQVPNERAANDKTRAPQREEFEEARRLNTDLKAIRTAIHDCLQQSDSGKALRAALEANGLMLANGDRRDCFVVVDAAGGQHALNKRLTGMTLAETRERLGDLDRAQLPGVEEARARQQERAVEVEKTQSRTPEPLDLRPLYISAANRTTEPAAPVFDRDAAEAAWTEQLTEAAIAHDETARQMPKPEREGEGPQPAEEGISTSQPLPENAPAPTASRPDIALEPETAKEPESELHGPEHAASGIFGGLARVADIILGGLFSFFGAAEPKLTAQQVHQKEQARGNDETLTAQAYAAGEQTKAEDHDWRMAEQKRQQQDNDLSFAQRFGTPPTQEANLGRERDERDDGWEHERER
jgi:hypothetical protein